MTRVRTGHLRCGNSLNSCVPSAGISVRGGATNSAHSGFALNSAHIENPYFSEAKARNSIKISLSYGPSKDPSYKRRASTAGRNKMIFHREWKKLPARCNRSINQSIVEFHESAQSLKQNWGAQSLWHILVMYFSSSQKNFIFHRFPWFFCFEDFLGCVFSSQIGYRASRRGSLLALFLYCRTSAGTNCGAVSGNVSANSIISLRGLECD